VSARTHPRAVGAFVLGATALVLVAVLLLTGGDWFQRRSRFAVYFPGSVRGLNRGAAVTFRGIKIGEVEAVTALLTGKPDPVIQIEVVIEFVGDVLKAPPGLPHPLASLTAEQQAKALIARGIRGRLMSQSLLTGQKYVDFDFLPQDPARLSGLNPSYPELPTTPTGLEKMGERVEDLMAKLGELPLDQMLEDLRRTVESARKVVESDELRGALSGARRATRELTPALVELRATVADARRLIGTLDKDVAGTGSDVRAAAGDLRRTLDRAERALASLESTLDGADQARVTAASTLEELGRTLKALRNLVDYVQTHPEAVVLGKAKGEEKK
jgi:paraquat-inducible protein B